MLFLTLWAQVQLDWFKQELTFGPANGGDEYLWVDSDSTLWADDQGQMILSDPLENRVLLFDEKGEFLRALAKQGQGPGEFQGLKLFYPFENGAYALEADQTIVSYHQFDSNYAFVEAEVKTGAPVIILHAQFNPQNGQFTANYVQPDVQAGVMWHRVATFDQHFNIVKMHRSQSGMANDPGRIHERRYWVARISENISRFFQNRTHFTYDAAGNLYLCDNRQIKLECFDAQGKKKQGFSYKTKAKPLLEADRDILLDALLEQVRGDRELMELITPAVVQEALDQAEIPMTCDPVFGLIALNPDVLLVVHELDHQTGLASGLVFKNGSLLGQVQLPHWAFVRLSYSGYVPAMTIKAGKAYSLQTDPAGELQVVRYQLQLP